MCFLGGNNWEHGTHTRSRNGPLHLTKLIYWLEKNKRTKTAACIIFPSDTRPRKTWHSSVIMLITGTEEQAVWLAEATGDNFTNAHNALHYSCTFMSCHNRTFTYLYDNRRAQSSTWQQGRDAARCQVVPADRVIWDVICFTKNTREEKEKGWGRYMSLCATIWNWMGWQWSCQHQSADNSLLLGKISLEETLMLKRRWNTGHSVIHKGPTVFTMADGECKWSMIVDLTQCGWIAVFFSNVYCMFEQTGLSKK